MSPFKIMDQLPYLLTVKTKNEMEEITIKKAQKMVDDWVNTLGVRYFNELTNMAILTEEVGEVARIMARKFGEQSNKKSDIKYELADELADVVFVLICIANQTGIDLEKAFIKNIDKKTNRDAQRHVENKKLKD
jgi:NTP pyrophosphatase (non-canonical NTP hydrolase)